MVCDGYYVSMKKIILSWLFCALPVVADAYVNRNAAVVKIMNKDAGKVQQVGIPVNQEVQFE